MSLKKMKAFEEKIQEMDRVMEIMAEQIANTQGDIQNSMTELTNHFIRNSEPKIKLIVRKEVDKILAKTGK